MIIIYNFITVLFLLFGKVSDNECPRSDFLFYIICRFIVIDYFVF